ncbi:MAG TPA: extracellular solute-binding protein [Ktedonosporobacter sp.]|nr:extracellular solute-binding protein [Ktedonosporobacter sp.]
MRFSSMNRRTFLTRSALAVGTVSGSSALLAACGPGASSGGTATTAPSAPVTLNVMQRHVQSLVGSPSLSKENVIAFEKANNCKINWLEFDQVKLNASLVAGDAPDLVRIEGAAASIPYIAARGLAEPLDDYFAKATYAKTDDLADITKVYRYDGKQQGQGPIYGMPFDYSQDGMLWYNKKLFDQAKVPYLSDSDPITYDQLLAMGKQLTTSQGGKIKVFGVDPCYGDVVFHAQLMQMIAQQGYSLWNSDFTKADFTTPAAKKALQWFVDWGQAHVGPGPLDPNPESWDGPLYQENRLAIVEYGYWFNGQVTLDANAKPTPDFAAQQGFAPAPQMGTTRVDACRSATGMWIPKKAKNKELAFKFLDFWYAGPQSQMHFKTGQGLPPLKSQLALLPQDGINKTFYDVQQKNLANLSVLSFSPYVTAAAMDSVLTTNLNNAIKGQMALNDAIAAMQKQVADLIQQGRDQVGS